MKKDKWMLNVENSIKQWVYRKCPKCNMYRIFWFDVPYFNYTSERIFFCTLCNTKCEEKEMMQEISEEV